MTRPRKRTGFRCRSCGQWHDELMTDIGFNLPDDVWALGYIERYRRAQYNADFCTLDRRRYFIRCVLAVPFTYREDFFGWGVWVEVERRHHALALARFARETSGVAPFDGTVANRIRGFRNTVGLKVSLQLYDDHRPYATLPPDSRHRLAREQRQGMDAARHHEIVAPLAPPNH